MRDNRKLITMYNMYDKLVSLVEKMLELQKKHHEARMERDKELYERQIHIVDKQIDKLVYELYGLSDEEIKVIEGMER
jgi:adenine-specific DNA-methyltransferase